MSKLLDLIHHHRAQSGNDGDQKVELFGLSITDNMLRQILREIDGTTRGVPPSEIAGTVRTVPQR
jgi:hypothetical protein